MDLGLFIGQAGLMPKHISSFFLLWDDASFLNFVTGPGDVYTLPICLFLWGLVMIQLIFSNPSNLKYKTTPSVEREERKSLLK